MRRRVGRPTESCHEQHTDVRNPSKSVANLEDVFVARPLTREATWDGSTLSQGCSRASPRPGPYSRDMGRAAELIPRGVLEGAIREAVREAYSEDAVLIR